MGKEGSGKITVVILSDESFKGKGDSGSVGTKQQQKERKMGLKDTVTSLFHFWLEVLM